MYCEIEKYKKARYELNPDHTVFLYMSIKEAGMVFLHFYRLALFP